MYSSYGDFINVNSNAGIHVLTGSITDLAALNGSCRRKSFPSFVSCCFFMWISKVVFFEKEGKKQA